MDKDKNILMIGDSLFRGTLGINFINMLDEAFPSYRFINRGKGGDTLIGIANRLEAELQEEHDYDIIVIEAGHNDILIPVGEHREFWHRVSSHYYQARGSIVTEEEDFEARYDEMITMVRRYTDVPIIVTTLSCLGEDLATEPNLKRARLNEAIIRVAKAHDLILADVGAEFDACLKASKEPKSLLFTQFATRTLVDVLRSSTVEGAKAMSEERGMMLVIDGVHLNGEGARLYFETIKERIETL